MKNRNIYVIIVAAGKGVRTGEKIKKQYIKINGLPLICYALKTFDKCENIDKIYLVVPEIEMKMCEFNFVKSLNLSNKTHIVGGGSSRQNSVMNALKVINNVSGSNNSYILIHDAARPFVTRTLISECIKGVKKTGACVPVIQAVDSLKKIIYSESKSYLKSIKRENIWLAQTPQAFDFKLIFNAHLKAKKNNVYCTDDSSIAEFAGIPLNIILGSSYNIKVTTKDDLIVANAIAKLVYCF